ncbi:hypothetical protein ABT147_00465 [Streptomyces sp. NPDC001868]|uniref:hypothetical protein n=1 Tax=Streptomyces sp. NPDC001868 TaxID=3154401 RepID=UPI003318FEAA
MTRPCPSEPVDRVVSGAGRSENRQSLLSARYTVYFVPAMCSLRAWLSHWRPAPVQLA